MKLRLFYFITIILALLAVACTSEYDLNDVRRAKAGEDVVFYATIEGSGEAETKVYADNQMRVLWNAEDQISIFNKNTNNQPYRFNGEDGDNAGSFSIVSANSELPSGNPVEHIYSVYPYAAGTTINSDGVMTLTLPVVQHYRANSFGLKANTMVSATDDTQLQFKNACGYLSFKFYGEGISVKSILIKGNNHEKLAGKAAITMPVGGLPTVVMQNTAAEEITLTCDNPVALNANANDYIEFWLVLPPTDFTQGFTVTVTDALGGTFVKSTSRDITISRNNLSRMSPMEVVPEYLYVPFADANFKSYCIENFDRDDDGEISMEEASDITEINVSTVDIESLQGIEFMPNLRYLYCYVQSYSNKGKLTSLDISNNTVLTHLCCYNNQLISLDVSNNTALKYLYCYNNHLTSLDVSHNTALTYVDCSFNQLTSLEVSNNSELTSLKCDDNQLASLEVSNNSALMYLDCQNNQLTSLDVSQKTALTKLVCYNNQLTSLDVSHDTALTYLSCYSNQLTGLDVSNVTELTSLNCDDNQLASLDVSHNTALTMLSCRRNQLTSLDVSNNSVLSGLNCTRNAANLVISIRSGQIFKTFSHDNTASIVEKGDPIPQGNITFTDPTFKTYCVNQFDVDKDGELSYAEALLITEVRCSNQTLTSLSGIEFFTNLRCLRCEQNQLKSLDVSHNTALTDLDCHNNQLTSLNVSNNIALTVLYCDDNQLTSLDVSKNTALTYLSCYSNQLTSLDVSYNTSLTDLGCSNNQLTSLNVSNNSALMYLKCDNNQLASLVVSNNTALKYLYCEQNQLTSLDVNQNTALTVLYCDNNQLTSLDVSKNAALTNLYCKGNPNLAEIWLKTNQTIPKFYYDLDITTIKYKD